MVIELAERTQQESCVWVEVADLVDKYSPIDLGIGKPDVETAPFIKQALIDTQSQPDKINQYTHSMGHPELVKTLSEFYSIRMMRTIDQYTQIVTTNGADGSIFCSMMALINPGDEVIIFQPYYDSFVSTVNIAQGVPIFVNLNINDCNITTEITFDRNELVNAFTSRTKLIVINSPHNPTGKVFNRDELQFVADLCIKHDIICLCDCVYEHYIYSNSEHIYMCTLENMWERTITIASAGKAFNVTGWKLGWSIGPENLIQGIHTIHTICNYTSPSVIQEAVASCFKHQLNLSTVTDDYWHNIRTSIKHKRDKIVASFQHVGLKCIVPEAGYFLVVDFEPLIKKYIINYSKTCMEEHNSDDAAAINHLNEYDVVKWLIKEKKLMGVPLGPFYNIPNRNIGKRYIRFSFFKNENLLESAKRTILTILMD